MPDFMKNRTELIISEEKTNQGYITESEIYEMCEDLNGLCDENYNIPVNVSYSNEKKNSIVRYYDLAKVLYKEVEKWENSNLTKKEILYENDEDNKLTIRIFNRKGRCIKKMYYNNGVKTRTEIIEENIEENMEKKNDNFTRNGDLVFNNIIKIDVPNINNNDVFLIE